MSDSSATVAADRWKPGTSILYQEVWGEALLAARPITVVSDDAGLLVLYSHPRAILRSAAIGSARRRMTLEQRIAAMMSKENRAYEQRTASDSHVLVLAAEVRWSAVWLFWTADWKHVRWYVNLQQPLRRTQRGVQVRDCALDLVVDPNRSWRWKDRDEFEALRTAGFFSEEIAKQVMAEAERMIGVIERWESPFSDGWERWRADSNLRLPTLGSDWNVVEH